MFPYQDSRDENILNKERNDVMGICGLDVRGADAAAAGLILLSDCIRGIFFIVSSLKAFQVLK